MYHVADRCHICEQSFKKIKKVRDHYHIGVERGSDVQDYSNFRGAACNSILVTSIFKNQSLLPLFFTIYEDLMDISSVSVLLKVIAQNMERYVSFFHWGFTLY